MSPNIFAHPVPEIPLRGARVVVDSLSAPEAHTEAPRPRESQLDIRIEMAFARIDRERQAVNAQQVRANAERFLLRVEERKVEARKAIHKNRLRRLALL